METHAGFGEPGGESGRADGLRLLLGLTNALCGLGCMEDAQGRLHFGVVLGDLLGRQIDLRGVKLREDVVLLVRAALNMPGGERVLVEVVRILEGDLAGDELDQLLAQWLAPAPPPALQGPLTCDDEACARALLAQGDLPAARLRDALVEELNGLDLPTGLTPEQFLAHVLDWNVQPDGLPPAVLLVDHAARLAAAIAHRTALAGWAEDWARRAGLTGALEERRRVRGTATSDPDIPRCLVIAVEPARDGTGEIIVRPWLNTVPGHWNPQPGEPAMTTLDELGTAVQRALRQGARLWSAPRDPDTSGRRQPPPYIEFVLPYDLLNHDVAGLTFRIGDGQPLPLSLKYGVHLRSLERMRTDDALVRDQWRERWRTLREDGVMVHGWREPDGGRLGAWQSGLAGEPRHTAVVLDAPTDVLALEALKAAIAEGIGIAIWDRRGVFREERREVVTALFAAAPTPARIPVAVHLLRRTAESEGRGPGELLGRHIGFFWDDPTRPVDFQPTDPGDLASEEAPA
ncbi:effector-associated domain 2-containing protein [Streptomyces massasporeus]|uniref:VMAP-C domain-containing protein n=1 Tax=Streptomyces massasporeus TaxID=67324 RepID=UPI003327DF31